MDNKRNNNANSESYTKVITELHNALERNNFDKVLEIITQVGSKNVLEDIGQAFLLTYHYNFRTRFFEKADFNYCLQFSDILNKRTSSL